jgi:CheY-like chemotaxis protein
MSPENANVFLVDDEASWLRAARKSLHDAGHTVVLEAVDAPKAQSLISLALELDVNVAVLDVNLTGLDFRGVLTADLAEKLRQQIPDIKIIAYGSQDYSFADEALTKLQHSKLGQLVKSL